MINENINFYKLKLFEMKIFKHRYLINFKLFIIIIIVLYNKIIFNIYF